MNATEPDPNVDISSPSVASFGQQPVSHQGLAQRRAECHQNHLEEVTSQHSSSNHTQSPTDRRTTPPLTDPKIPLPPLDLSSTSDMIDSPPAHHSAKPRSKTSSEYDPFAGLSFKVGVAENKNSTYRSKMEDVHTYIANFAERVDWGYFAIFDGHAEKIALAGVVITYTLYLNKKLIWNCKIKTTPFHQAIKQIYRHLSSPPLHRTIQRVVPSLQIQVALPQVYR